MKPIRIPSWLLAGFALLAGLAALVPPARAQAGRTQPDLFDSMVASASSFDMDSAVEAQAEFDPPVASPGARIIYRVTVSALDESLEVPTSLPAPDGLALRLGGRGQNYVPTADRKVRPECTLIFHGIAPTNGSYTVPAFQAMAYGKPIQIPAATLVVAPDGAAAPQAPAMVVNLPAADIYVGETFAIPLALPRPPDNSVLGMSEPRITGQFIFSEELPAMVRQESVQRDGQSLPAFVSDVVITPLREGPLELVGQAFNIGMRPIPGRTNASRIATELVDSEPVTLQVRPLPADGRLPGFTGAVGQFKLDPPGLSANVVRAGEPLTLTITIRSPGEIGRVTPPPPPVAQGWQSFPPVAGNPPTDPPQPRDFESFNYTLIPASSEFKSTPAIPFSYFDPQQKAYVDLTIPSLPITVDPAPANEAQAPLLREAPRPGNDDDSADDKLVLAGLTAAPGPSAATLAPLQQSGWFWALQLVPAAALGGLWAWDRRRRHLRDHPEIFRKRRARRGMRRQLRLARRAAAARDAAGFARGAADALREACAPHGAANPGALVCADVLQELPAPEQQGPAGDTVRRLFAAADASRFGGPPEDGSRLLSLQPELEQLLEQLKTRLQ
jgi:hypothetical protein